MPVEFDFDPGYAFHPQAYAKVRAKGLCCRSWVSHGSDGSKFCLKRDIYLYTQGVTIHNRGTPKHNFAGILDGRFGAPPFWIAPDLFLYVHLYSLYL